MNNSIRDEQLERWLHEAAEADAPTLDLPAVLANRVQKKFRRRQYVRRTLGAAAVVAVLFITAGIVVFHRGPPERSSVARQPVSISSVEIEQLQARLAALEKELAAQKTRLELLAKADRNQRENTAISAEALLPPEALAQITWEQTAVMVLDRAERLAAAKKNDEAAVEYRRIIDDFPTTGLVDTAKKQLQQLTSNYLRRTR
jgi:hypothetical protein